MPDGAVAAAWAHLRANHDLLNLFFPETCGVSLCAALRLTMHGGLYQVLPVCLSWQTWMCELCQHLARSACPKQLFTQFESILVNWVNNSPLQKIYKSINMSLYIPNRQK